MIRWSRWNLGREEQVLGTPGAGMGMERAGKFPIYSRELDVAEFKVTGGGAEDN